MYDTPRQSPHSSCQLLQALGQSFQAPDQLLHAPSQMLHALSQWSHAPILNLQDSLTQCNSTEFTITQPIILDKIEHSATSIPNDAKIAGNSFL
jgi:hypothetical protein